MSERRGPTADELERSIELALKDGNIEAVAILVRWLSTVDANRAQVVFDTLELGVALARRREVQHKPTVTG